MPYSPQPLRGFRRLAMAFWNAPNDPTIYGNMEVDCTKANRFVADMQERHGLKITMGQLVGRGIAYCVKNVVPEVNAKVIWGRPCQKDSIDIYFQVDLGDGKDLSGVTVGDCGNKNALELAQELKRVAEKLRAGRDKQYEKTQKGLLGRLPVFVIRWMMSFFLFLEYNLGITPRFLGARPEPFGTIMVSNVGMFGIDTAFAPLVPPSRVPFVCLVGRVRDMPWVVDGEITIRPIITVNASFDHRVIDGNKIGKIVRTVRAYLEDPYAYEPELCSNADHAG